MNTNSVDSLGIILSPANFANGTPDLEHLKMLLQDWVSSFYSDSLGNTNISINGNLIEIETDNSSMIKDLLIFTDHYNFLKVKLV